MPSPTRPHGSERFNMIPLGGVLDGRSAAQQVTRLDISDGSSKRSDREV